jgi:hypothetical protein
MKCLPEAVYMYTFLTMYSSNALLPLTKLTWKTSDIFIHPVHVITLGVLDTWK